MKIYDRFARKFMVFMLCASFMVMFINFGKTDKALAGDPSVTLRYTNYADDSTQEATITFDGPTVTATFPDWDSGKIEAVTPETSGFYSVFTQRMEGIVDGINPNEFGEPQAIEFSQKFGRVAIHVFTNPGGSAVVTFIQPSFIGAQVTPDLVVGDWGQTMANLSLNNQISDIFYGSPSVVVSTPGIGMVGSIQSIISPNDITLETLIEGTSYRVTLPPVSSPSTIIRITFVLTDESVVTKQFTIRRMAVRADSLMFDRNTTFKGFYDEENPENSVGLVNWGSEAGNHTAIRTFVTYTGHNDFPVTNPKLLVQYYNETSGQKTLLGVKQFDVNNPVEGNYFNYVDGNDADLIQKDILVYSSLDQTIGIAGANLISVFLISGGINADSSAFGGIQYGVGAGWEELMVNHPEHIDYDIWLNGLPV